MKRAVPFSIVLALIISLAAPAGAAFASDEAIEEPIPPPIVLEEAGTSVEQAPSQMEVTDLPPAVPVEAEAEYLEQSIEPLPELGVLPVELPATTAPLTSVAVVIAQIQVGAAGNASDEYVSIYNNSDEVIDVTGWCLRNKNGVNFACLNEADVDYSLNPRAYIGFSSVPDREGSHGLVVRFIAGSNRIVAGGDTIQLIGKDQVIDEVAWTSSPSSHYAIERLWDTGVPNRLRIGSGSWAWKAGLVVYGHILELVECGEGVMVVEGEECPRINACDGVVISEIAANVDEQFIELNNLGDSVALLAGCQLLTNRNNNTYIFPEDAAIDPGGFFVVLVNGTDLTLTKTTSGTVRFLSSNGLVEIDNVSYRNLSKDTSWSIVGGEWIQTYAVTPGDRNINQQYLPCDEGYWRNLETGRCNKNVEVAVAVDCGEGRERNPETGRCRNLPSPKELAPCREGQYRSEETNRCRSIAIAAASVLKPCADGQFRNPETNRCKKIASAEDVALADCGEGRERNPATNRCRNVVVAGTLADTLPFPVEKAEASAEHFVGWWTLGIVAVFGAGYGAWEWREELLDVGRRAGRFIARSK